MCIANTMILGVSENRLYQYMVIFMGHWSRSMSSQLSRGGVRPIWLVASMDILTDSDLLFLMGWNGYGSIPINTIFSGMNIHLPAILMWTTGVQGFDTLPNQFISTSFMVYATIRKSDQTHMFKVITLRCHQTWPENSQHFFGWFSQLETSIYTLQ